MKYIYPTMIILSIIINVIVVIILSKKFNYNKYELISMILIDVFGILFGGLMYSKIVFNNLGFASLGGVVGSFLMLYIYSFSLKKDYKYILILFMPSIPLMYAIGKIGCFVAGCCYGIPYDGIGHIIYHNSRVAPINTALFPVQIVETIVFILIFIYVIQKYKKEISVRIVMKEVILCSIAKFILDFFRYEHIGKLLSSNQIVCLILLISSFVYLYKINKNMNLVKGV